MDDSKQRTTNRLIWYAIAAAAAVDAGWVVAAHIRFDLAGTAPIFAAIAGFALVSFIYGHIRKDERLWLFGNIANQMLCGTGAIGTLSYLAARWNFPLQDAWLISLDHMLSFDWQHYLAVADQYPLLTQIFALAYASSGPQMIGIMALLFICNKMPHLQHFTVIFLLTALATVMAATLWPATGGYLYYHTDMTLFHNIHPATARLHEAPLLGMRDHTIETLTFPMQGLVAFPSFHSTLSILLIYAAWPIRPLRGIFLLLNMLVLASTPVEGGHYLTDIIAGVAVAFLGIYVVERAFGRDGKIVRP